MNNIHRSIWNQTTRTFVAASENARTRGGANASASPAVRGRHGLKAIAIGLMLAFGANAWALPTGGAVSAGTAGIATTATTTTVNQTSQNVSVNWQSFSIGAAEAVHFVQPNSSSVALNRVLGSDPSSILGSLSANGKVFLVNPNGILFGQGAQVNVAGLVASTLSISDGDFMAGRYNFTGNGTGNVLNQGTINADGGYVALLGANVSNQGVISARLGTIVLAAGSAMTLDMAGDGLLNVAVNQGAVNALVENGGMIRADGGNVLLTALAAGNLLQSAVNNTGVIQAQTIGTHEGTIRLMGDMAIGTVNTGGTLDASAPNGGNGGFIETSAAHVNVQDSAHVTTAAALGVNGTWLIDPLDFSIGNAPGDNITTAALAAQLNLGNVTITTAPGAGNGDIFFRNAMGGGGPVWNPGAGTPTTLTLNAARDFIQLAGADITATNGNVVVCCGRDITLNAAITTTNGSVLLSAGRNVTLTATGAITATDGNVAMCAGGDILINGAMTQTRTSAIAGHSLAELGVRQGLTLSAGTAASGVGLAGGGGSVTIVPPGPTITVTNAPVTVIYNPVSYAVPVTDFTLKFTAPAPLTVQRLVFPSGADKVADGTTTAVFTSFQDAGFLPVGLTLNPGGTANFDTAAAGAGKPITFSGTLGGPGAAGFALPVACCGPAVGRVFGTILPVVPPVPPVVPDIIPPAVALAPIIQNFVGSEFPRNIDGLNLSVVPYAPPPIQLAIAPPEVIPVIPVIVPPPVPPQIYVPPVRERKPDRN